ncbi:hypothetical protein VOLCADRAFT_107754 [Volvox carteri f. nagariensis]|uniref:Uncharacterized protein n=1 Tax=Volvox carteri f. nagariensis TaxID=3068 RepID=D8UG38_VOLCA|nr:uncharacterized protein VOLCADRAFT_107754 [Volvox carteri f. nagariensis]EFJ41310.1 hypothetical protein VOLCADRAFT_107754 [Volvox carteri f. nagariensis]|eukprot:XP_002957644.1 hypothetical protein VOLCADRAFT_107754 [Volvox carteri f. nagariensis]
MFTKMKMNRMEKFPLQTLNAGIETGLRPLGLKCMQLTRKGVIEAPPQKLERPNASLDVLECAHKGALRHSGRISWGRPGKATSKPKPTYRATKYLKLAVKDEPGSGVAPAILCSSVHSVVHLSRTSRTNNVLRRGPYAATANEAQKPTAVGFHTECTQLAPVCRVFLRTVLSLAKTSLRLCGKLLTTHGYYYNSQRSYATWLSDTWAMGAADGFYAWQRLSDHLSQSEAFDAYSTGRKPRAPCGRFGHVSAVIDDALLLYGGNDGGYSRTNLQDYKPGNDFDDLWRLDLVNHTWSPLQPAGEGPGKRHMAGAAAVQGKLVLYGGIGRGRGDIWSYSPAENRWELLSVEVPKEHGGPGSRCGHALLPWLTGLATGVIMYGGQSQLPNGSYTVHDDAWFFDLATRRWRKLQHAPEKCTDTAPPPPPLTSPPGHFYSASMVTTLTLPPSAVRAAVVAAAAGTKACQGSAGGASEDVVSAPSTALEDVICEEPSQGGPSPAAASGPGPAAAVNEPVRVHVGIIAGGSTTTPGLTCSPAVWAFTTDCAATRIIWARLPDLPAGLYDTRGAAVGGAAYVFGGHLCRLERPSQPPYPYYYVNEVQRLDLGLGLDQDLNLNLNLDPDRGVDSVSVPGVAALLRGGLDFGGAEGAAAAVTAAACVASFVALAASVWGDQSAWG